MKIEFVRKKIPTTAELTCEKNDLHVRKVCPGRRRSTYKKRRDVLTKLVISASKFGVIESAKGIREDFYWHPPTITSGHLTDRLPVNVSTGTYTS